MSYIRINIYLTSKQKADLKRLAATTGIKFSELVRLALNEFIKGKEQG